MAIGRTVYSYTFFSRQSIVMGLFISQNNVSMTFFYRAFRLELYFPLGVSVFLPNGRSFLLKLVVTNTCLANFVAWLKRASPYTSQILLSVSHGLQFSATKILMTDLCSSLLHVVWFAAILIFLEIKIIFAINQFKTMQNLHRWKKKRKFILPLKKTNLFIQWPSYVYTQT